jgi:septal ring factor EnvC (AmiA/AmiB activator)
MVLQAQQEKLAQEESRFLAFKKKLDEKERALAGQIARKNGVLKTIDSERMLHATRLKRLRISTQGSPDLQEEIRKIEAIEELFQEQIFERKGRLRSPVEGSVVLGYGWLPDDELGTKIRFKGHLIGAKPRNPVSSVFKGRVILAESIEGYGPTVVVDHGSHYFSVYGNLSELEVRVGQKVAEGQRVGLTGERRAFFGQGLYFELRHFSDPENPRLWIAANQTESTGTVRRKGRQ